MNVLVMNESTGKSFQKAKSIISKYLTQLGQKTYSGSISLEGLETLFAELKLNSSKYMSISCIEQKNNPKNNFKISCMYEMFIVSLSCYKIQLKIWERLKNVLLQGTMLV